jgi:hypothetical protein
MISLSELGRRVVLVFKNLWFAYRIEQAQKEVEERPFYRFKSALRETWEDTKHYWKLAH